ncbi:hypothetical protein FGM00_07455 [Aggregatimonas sangjinii]|uniref:Uncharacterized protein n=1 Tax=Aggregatimonas sangjinii TaxID=2583587 RepID=A0A5B7SSF6_9FLAO|nr:hypothetical protein [Aggregatimonas sangjinii]QCW99942.1 hypothetical protein FGM00_07455 [Aggregatimonas sangjinii]
MKNYVFLIVLLVHFSSCHAQKKILVLGTKFKQSDLCAELGFAKHCNPFPYGTPLVLQKRRWCFPTKEKSKNRTTNDETLDIHDIAHKYIGGIMVNQKLPVPAADHLQKAFKEKEYIDIHKASVRITLKDSIINTFDIKGSIDNILSAAVAGEIVGLEKFIEGNFSKVENELSQIYSRIKRKGMRINLVYHSIKLNGNWYKEALNQNPTAIEVLDTTKIKNPLRKHPYLKNDRLAFIGGMGIIEYDVSSVIDLDKDLDLGIDKTLESILKIQVKRELEREIEKVVPSKYDLVFVSLLARTY